MPVVYIVIALFALKHFLASYPLQCSYTVKGLGSSGWFKPMLARCSIQSACTALLALGYWMKTGAGINVTLLVAVMGLDFVSHFLIDRMKVSPEFLGRYQVASPQELAQMAVDYQSKDIAVVKAAQAESDSNKYFWWCDGLCHLLYGLVGLYMAYLIQ
jgi:hypothetical protein